MESINLIGDKRGITGEALTEILLWVVFILLAGGGIYFLIKYLSG